MTRIPSCRWQTRAKLETLPKIAAVRSTLNEKLYVCFGRKFFKGVLANLARCVLHPETSRWRTDTGSSYNFVTENDINMMSSQRHRFRARPIPTCSFVDTALSISKIVWHFSRLKATKFQMQIGISYGRRLSMLDKISVFITRSHSFRNARAILM